MLVLWLTAGVLARAGEAPPEPPITAGVGGYGGLSPSRRLTKDEDDALERALRDLDRTVRQARTPRVRKAKIGMAVEAADRALSIASRSPLPEIVAVDLADVRAMLAEIQAGIVAFADARESLQTMVRAVMLAAAVEAEEDEEAIWLLMMA